MKNGYLVVFLIFLFTCINSLHSQEYSAFPDSNARWKVVYHSYPPGPMPSYDLHFDNYILGDTLINDSIYKKVYQLGYDPDCSLNTYGPTYIGAYRNIEPFRRVYFIPESDTIETLLYDFSLNIGDTVPQTYINWAYPDLIVSDIDSILIGNNYRKRFYYLQEYYPPIEVVEGIGAHTGLLEPMEIFEYQHYLRCFYLEGELLYIYNADSCSLETDTCISVNINDKIFSMPYVEVTPNPVINNLRVEISNLPQGDETYNILILNTLGVTQISCIFKSRVKVLSLEDLSPGVYIWVLQHKNHPIMNGKILKL